MLSALGAVLALGSAVRGMLFTASGKLSGFQQVMIIQAALIDNFNVITAARRKKIQGQLTLTSRHSPWRLVQGLLEGGHERLQQEIRTMRCKQGALHPTLKVDTLL